MRAAAHHTGLVMRSLHDLLPGLVDPVEPLGLLGQLLGDVAADKHGLQVHLANERRVSTALTNQRRALTILTNQSRVLTVLTNQRPGI